MSFPLLDLGINDTRKGMNLIHLTQLLLLQYIMKSKNRKYNITIGYYQKNGMRYIIASSKNMACALYLFVWNSICCQSLRNVKWQTDVQQDSAPALWASETVELLTIVY